MRLKPLQTLLTAALTALTAGCSTLERLPAVPQASAYSVEILDRPNTRFRIPGDTSRFVEEGIKAQDHEKAANGGGPLPPAHLLAISGGGDSGAFGAGLLIGWTEHGSRPDFKVVTGVSTGALSAPYAFLGPAYDDQLKAVYTRVGPDDIYEEQYISGGLFGEAAADSSPLKQLFARHISVDVLDAIAHEYEKGRLLFIVTTDLDSMTPVIWNMGAIAASQAPGSLQLFRDILAASAAIPGVFPPVMIDALVDGVPHQEMHVDGGVSTQVFLYPPTARAFGADIERRERHLYIIRNARIAAKTETVKRGTLDILQRAISGLIRSQGIGDLYRIYTLARQDGIDYNLAHIDERFDAPKRDDFDTGFMNALFEYGRKAARDGYSWRDRPPGLALPEEAD